jgi:predicted nucleic acid-binding OB-fold protein
MARRTKKEIIISKIKRIIEEFGSFSVADVEHESSPVVNSIGKDSFVLAERFNSSDVDVVHYVHETVVSEDSIDYEDLPTDTLEDILSIAENYVVDMDKTMERCRG